MTIDYRSSLKTLLRAREVGRRCRLMLSTMVCNLLGIVHMAWLSVKHSPGTHNVKRLIVLGFGGIGNHLMLTPALRGLKKQNPSISIHLLTHCPACRDLLARNPHLSDISVTPFPGRRDFLQAIRFGRALRRLKPDAILSAAGTNPVTGSLIAFFSGARLRIGEDWKGRGFLYTHRVKVGPDIYEAEQNIRLARRLDFADVDCVTRLHLSPQEFEEGKAYIDNLNIERGKMILGIHPGSGNEQSWKRWPMDRFIGVAAEISRIQPIFPLFFFGPDEQHLASRLLSDSHNQYAAYIGGESLRMTAEVIGFCDLFLSNDSGLRHIATALGLKTLTIFGPTSTKKNHHNCITQRAIFRKDVLCRPCHYTTWWLACGDRRPCLGLIDEGDVIRELSALIDYSMRSRQTSR